MSLSPRQLAVIGLIGLLIVGFIVLISGIIPGTRRENTDEGVIKGTLSVWGIGENNESFQTILSGFNKFKGLTVVYQDFKSLDEYETALLEGLATGTGPDIFMIRNDMLPKYENKLSPLLPSTLSPYQLSELFPSTVEKDFVADGQIYALPLYLDTLALFYNRDLFAQHAVFSPATWDDLVTLIPKLTEYGPGRQIVSPGAAIGGSSKNMKYAVDLLYLLMAQTDAASGERPANDSQKLSSPSGIQALEFYTQFANAGSSAYTWNNTLPDDLELFAEGKLPIWFGYASDAAAIKTRAPFLDFRTAAIPQLKGTSARVAFPRYFGFAVSRQSFNQALAWEFITELTTNTDNARAYAIHTGRLPALFQAMADYKDSSELSLFVNQAFIADSWVRGNPLLSDVYVSRMIESINGGAQTPNQAAAETQGRLNDMLERLKPTATPN